MSKRINSSSRRSWRLASATLVATACVITSVGTSLAQDLPVDYPAAIKVADPVEAWHVQSPESVVVQAPQSSPSDGAAPLLGGASDLRSTGGALPAAAGEDFAEGLVSLVPARLLDTRSDGQTIDGQFAAGGAVGGGSQIDLTVVGRGGVPASGVGAVVVNLTVTQPSAPGFITAYPTGTERPNASSLNFIPGQTVPNLVVAKVGQNGQISLFNSAGATHLVADIVGYFPGSTRERGDGWF